MKGRGGERAPIEQERKKKMEMVKVDKKCVKEYISYYN